MAAARSLLLAAVLGAGCSKPPPSAAPADAAPAPATSSAPTLRAPAPIPIVREEISVVVAGATEHWRLEWRRPPTPECMDEAWSTCPCQGIEFGEEGELDLVRERDGVAPERLELDALFMNHTAALPRWQTMPPVGVKPGRGVDVAAVPTPEALRLRPLARVMKLADYDHDGHATEFVLRVGYEACGHSPSLVVGVDTKNPELHAFGTADAPNEPLLLENPAQWETVRRALPATLTKIGCGDHGSDVEQTLRVTRDATGLHVATSEKRCPP